MMASSATEVVHLLNLGAQSRVSKFTPLARTMGDSLSRVQRLYAAAYAATESTSAPSILQFKVFILAGGTICLPDCALVCMHL